MPNHAHTLTGRPLVRVAATFIVFGLIEFIIGAFLRNDAVVVQADGLHNLADAAMLIGANWLEERWTKSSRKGLSCCGVGRIRIALGALAPCAYGTGLVIGMLTRGQPDNGSVTGQETSLAIWLGIISIGVNIWCHRGTIHHGHGGLIAHLKSDIVGSAAIIVVALLVPFTASLNPLITVTALNVMGFIAWKEVQDYAKAIGKCDHKLAVSVEEVPETNHIFEELVIRLAKHQPNRNEIRIHPAHLPLLQHERNQILRGLASPQSTAKLSEQIGRRIVFSCGYRLKDLPHYLKWVTDRSKEIEGQIAAGSHKLPVEPEIREQILIGIADKGVQTTIRNTYHIVIGYHSGFVTTNPLKQNHRLLTA